MWKHKKYKRKVVDSLYDKSDKTGKRILVLVIRSGFDGVDDEVEIYESWQKAKADGWKKV